MPGYKHGNVLFDNQQQWLLKESSRQCEFMAVTVMHQQFTDSMFIKMRFLIKM